MKEYFVARIEEKDARKLFEKNEGKLLGDGGSWSVREIRIAVDDPRLKIIGELELKRHYVGKYFYSVGGFDRQYTQAELESALLFRCYYGRLFQPAGEVFGTVYDETLACPECKSGAQQAGPLRLKLSAIPKRYDFAVTIADEYVVSARAAEIFQDAGITGLDFGPILNGKKGKEPSTDWFQFLPTRADADVVAPTWFGTDPFSWDKNEYRCSLGDKIGFHIFSQVSVRRDFPPTDVFQTRQFIGERAGMLRPRRPIMVSQKFRRLCVNYKLKGCDFDIANFTSQTLDLG